jgi:hypothetical protein
MSDVNNNVIKTRIKFKTGTVEDWCYVSKDTDYIPALGEPILYTDGFDPMIGDYLLLKIGDGQSTPDDLPIMAATPNMLSIDDGDITPA